METRTKIILAEGFLGTGKTTLLAAAARELWKGGKRVGLVGTAFLRSIRSDVEEVRGSCFCCDFDGLMDAGRRLGEAALPEVVVAEPAGRCTDPSATILQPLKSYHRDSFDLAPLSVLAAPGKLDSILSGCDAGLDPDAA
jgi:G3E family GTPase